MFSIRARAQSDQSGVRGIVKGRNPLSQGMTGFPEELDWKCWSWLASRREWRLSIGLELWQVPFETVRRRVWKQKEKDWKTNTAWRKSSLLMGEEEDKSRKKDKLDKMALTLMGKSRICSERAGSGWSLAFLLSGCWVPAWPYLPSCVVFSVRFSLVSALQTGSPVAHRRGFLWKQLLLRVASQWVMEMLYTPQVSAETPAGVRRTGSVYTWLKTTFPLAVFSLPFSDVFRRAAV